MKKQQNKQKLYEKEAGMLAASEEMKTTGDGFWEKQKDEVYLPLYLRSLSLLFHLIIVGAFTIMLYLSFCTGSRPFSLPGKDFLELQGELQRQLDCSIATIHSYLWITILIFLVMCISFSAVRYKNKKLYM